MDESEELAFKIEQLEKEVITTFGSNIVLLLAALKAILDFFGLTKIKLSFNLKLPSDVTARDPQYQPVTPSPMTVYTNQSIGKLPLPVMPGYELEGWYTTTSFTTKIKDYSRVTFTKDTTLYAKWVKGLVKVTLNPNGGTVYPAEIYCRFDNEFGTLPEPTMADNDFSNWVNEADVPVFSYTILSSYLPITLYAKYNEFNYKLIYDANGGVGKVPPTTYHKNSDGQVPLETGWNQLFRPGYDFAGWAEAKNSPEVVSIIEPLWMDTKVYACWTPHIYHLKYANTTNSSITTKDHSTLNIKYGDVYELDEISEIGLFNNNVISIFDAWYFGSKRVRNNEYVANLTKRHNDTVYFCYDDSYCCRYHLSAMLQNADPNSSGEYTYTTYNVRDISCPRNTSMNNIFFVDDLQELPVDSAGFDFHQFKINNGSWQPKSAIPSIKNTNIAADTEVVSQWNRHQYTITYQIKSDKTNNQYKTIVTKQFPFQRNLASIPSETYVDPYASYDGISHSREIYKFTDWKGLYNIMPSKDITVRCDAVIIAEHVTITYYLNDGSGRYKNVVVRFTSAGTVTFTVKSLSELGYSNLGGFLGWSLNGSTISKHPGDSVTTDRSITYLGVWESGSQNDDI